MSATARSFLGSALGAGLALATQGCQQMAAQPARRRTIVDAQVHLWKASYAGPPVGVRAPRPQLPEPFTIERAGCRMMDEAGVDRVVIVPPSWEGYRNEYAMEAAKKWPHRFALMGRLRLDDPKSKDLIAHLEGSARHAGGPPHFQPIANQLAHRRHRRLVLAGCRQGRHPCDDIDCQAAPATSCRIVERNPDLVFIIDHMNVSDETAKQGKIPESHRPRWKSSSQGTRTYRLRCRIDRAQVVAGALPVPRLDRPPQASVRRLRAASAASWGTDLTNKHGPGNLPPARHPFHRGAEIPLGKRQGWVMGRAILQRLKWA